MLLVLVRVLLFEFSFHKWSIWKTIDVNCIGPGGRLVSGVYAVFEFAIPDVIVSRRISVWYQVAVGYLGTTIHVVTATWSRVGGWLVVYDLAHLIEHANARRPVAHDARFTYTQRKKTNLLNQYYNMPGRVRNMTKRINIVSYNGALSMTP